MSSSRQRAPLRQCLSRAPLALAIPRATESGELPALQPRRPSYGERNGAAVGRRKGFTRLAQRHADAYNRLFRHVSLCAPAEWRSLAAKSGLASVCQRVMGHSSISRGSWCLSLAPLWAAMARRPCLNGETPDSSLLMMAEPTNNP